MMRRFRYEYGASPLHLIAVILALALAYFALAQVFTALGATKGSFLAYFSAAIVAHDLVLYPLYSLVGLGLLVAFGLRPTGERRGARHVNHLRVPAVLSALLFVVWFPLILSLDEQRYEAASGQSTDGYLERWLLLTGALFAISGLILAVRSLRRT